MAEPTDWPALGAFRKLPDGLEYDRAVWGKLHGASSDFRWIAATPGFEPGTRRLEQELLLGPEEAPPASFPLWRSLEDSHLAVLCSRGRSVDAAGRRCPLVKQVVSWHRTEEVPPALAALLLLPYIATFDDSLWLDQESADGDGAPALLDPGAEPPVEVTPEGLAEGIRQGIEDLRKAVSPEALEAFYTDLLRGSRPAVLTTIGRPLTPSALAALLLPMPAERAARTSLAGWIPAPRARRDDLAASWDGIAVGTEAARHLADRSSVEPPAEVSRRAARWAEALLLADPTELADENPRAGTGAAPREEDRPIELAMWGPSASGKTVFLAQLFLAATTQQEDWQVWPTAELLEFSRAMRDRIDEENSFPPPTVETGAERVDYAFRRRSDGLGARLSLEDRAGVQWERLDDEVREMLERADGILLVIDPLRDEGKRDAEIRDTLDRLAVSQGGVRDERPLAVCLTKADTLIESPEDLRLALDQPDAFVERRLSRALLATLDQYYARYRLFPTSAVGVRLHWGVVEPAVFYDETLEPRIHPGAQPIHLLSPFTWLLDRAAERREGGRT